MNDGMKCESCGKVSRSSKALHVVCCEGCGQLMFRCDKCRVINRCKFVWCSGEYKSMGPRKSRS